MELDEIKQVSKELEDILEGFPDVPKEPMLQKVKNTENQPEDEVAAALDSEIDDQESEAGENLEVEPDLDAEPEELEPISRRATARRRCCFGGRMSARRQENGKGRISPMES